MTVLFVDRAERHADPVPQGAARGLPVLGAEGSAAPGGHHVFETERVLVVEQQVPDGDGEDRVNRVDLLALGERPQRTDRERVHHGGAAVPGRVGDGVEDPAEARSARSSTPSPTRPGTAAPPWCTRSRSVR